MPMKTIVPIRDETRPVLPTGLAAHHLDHSAQTLRRWACNGKGPLKPLRVGGRLAWPVADIKRLLGVA